MFRQTSFYVADWLDRRAKITPDRIALFDTRDQRDISYLEWNRAANRTANFLYHSLGVCKGDRVAIYATNSLEYLDVWMACGKIGAILQNLNWRLTPIELEQLLADAAPVALCYSGDFISQVNQIRPNLDSVRSFVAFGNLANDADCHISERDAFSDFCAADPSLTPDDAWVVCYTGGTTGLPKGAILTHGNMTWNAINTVSSWGLDQHDVAILNSPLFHTGALNVFTLPLISAGGKSILCSGFNADQVFDLIEYGEVTLFFGVPTMFLMLQQHARWRSADFTRLKMVISGGAPCPMPIFEEFWAKGVDFKTGYGLTEAGPNTFVLPQKDVRRKPGAVGFPLMHLDVRVVRDDGSECGADEIGELIIRGPHVTPGYWNKPDETAKAIRDGWLHTGDLANRDAEGYYKIMGRLKDMIISGGENVYPAEVESIMHGYPAVAEAALIGVPDEKWGEVGRAIVVVAAGQDFDEADFMNYLHQRLARYKVPKSVVLVDALPRTGPGKIDKKLLSDQYGR
ncbi:MAG: long-chain fatty acid--CoA ligase [Anaerolineae bacterium]|nr:long-chain fatty acid--CoA ligase [Anaerolineae bacterium]